MSSLSLSSSSSSRNLYHNRSAAASKASSPLDSELMLPILIYSSLRLLLRLLVPSIFPSITCFRRQFLHRMSAVQLTFLRFIACRMFLSSITLCNTSSFFTLSVKPNVLKVTANRLHPTARQFRPVGHEIACRAKTSLRLNRQDLAVESLTLKNVTSFRTHNVIKA